MNNIKAIISISNREGLIDAIEHNITLFDVIADLNSSISNNIKTAQKQLCMLNDTNIVMLTSSASQSFIDQMTQLGISVYLPKKNHATIIEKAIKDIYDKSVSSTKTDEVLKQPKGLLSKRELEVLQLICEQYTTSEIAEKLHISPRTVEGHRKKLLFKLGCRNTAGLVVYALQKQLVNMPISTF